MMDLAREQCPTQEHLSVYAETAEKAGFDALGLYLEHRYAFRCTPWAHGVGVVTPAMVRQLQDDFPNLQIIPFINLLGHWEGFLYTEEGKKHRAELLKGLQASASSPGFMELCEQMVDEVIQDFDSEIIHIGGDETAQLDAHPRDKARAEAYEGDGRAMIWGSHFGPLAQRVVDQGRRPAVWADMLLTHPEATGHLPKSTLLFEWQYDKGIAETGAKLKDLGFEVIGSPTIHVFNALWCHVEAADRNVRTVAQDVKDLGLAGVCLTTWEFGLFGSPETILPAIAGAARICEDPEGAPHLLESWPQESQEWARLMGVELQELGGLFAYPSIRHPLKVRLLLTGNPFLAWMHHAEELCGEKGARALEIIDRAYASTQDEAERGVCIFARSAIEFVRFAEAARVCWVADEPERALVSLAATRETFDGLERIARRSYRRFGGSLADIERCRTAKAHVETVMRRIQAYGRRELGYLPAFEVITNHRFMPHDQASWWVVNRWANE